MLYAIGFIGFFTSGGLTGLFLGRPRPLTYMFTTRIRRGAFPLHHGRRNGHGLSRGIHYWWPKMTGRMYPEGAGERSAVIIFVGFNLTFFPQYLVGYWGMPRRYHVYRRRVPGVERDVDSGRFHPRRRVSAAARRT